MIVVEGPDGAGKSSLVKALSELTGIAVAPKSMSPEQKALVNMRDYIEEALLKGFHPLMYDRFTLISGSIYGPLKGMAPPNDIYRNGQRLSDWLFRFWALLPHVIYCLPPVSEVRHNIYHGVADNSSVFGTWEQAYWAYWVKAHQDISENRQVLIYDYTKDSTHSVANWLSPRNWQWRA